MIPGMNTTSLNLAPNIAVNTVLQRVTVKNCAKELVYDEPYRTDRDRRALTYFLMRWLHKELPVIVGDQ